MYDGARITGVWRQRFQQFVGNNRQQQQRHHHYHHCRHGDRDRRFDPENNERDGVEDQHDDK
jgi:hypothetical protein